jgi:DNA oxidative demethylase
VINSQGASIALTLRDGRQEYNASMTLDLFPDEPAVEPGEEPIAPGAVLLRGFAQSRGPALLEAVSAVTSQSPFRFMSTPGGFQMSSIL